MFSISMFFFSFVYVTVPYQFLSFFSFLLSGSWFLKFSAKFERKVHESWTVRKDLTWQSDSGQGRAAENACGGQSSGASQKRGAEGRACCSQCKGLLLLLLLIISSLLILFKCSVMQLIQLNWTTLIHFHASYALSQTSNYVKRPGCIASELHFSSLQVLLTHF